MATLPHTGRRTAATVLGTIAIIYAVTLLAGSPGGRHASPTGTPATSPPTTSPPKTSPPTTEPYVFTLTLTSSSTHPALGQVHFDATHAWATSDGSTDLWMEMVSANGYSTGTWPLPAPATAAVWGIRGRTPYVITGMGVVIIDPLTNAMSAPLAGGGGQLAGVAFGVDRVWLLRHTATDYTLELWDTDLTSLVRVTHIGDAAPSALVGTLFDVYYAIDGEGVKVLQGDGTTSTVIEHVGHVTAMTLDTTLDPIVADQAGDVFHIDRNTRAPAGPALQIAQPIDAIAIDGNVFASIDRLSRTVTQRDPTTGRVIAIAELDVSPTSVGVVNGAIWVGGQGFVQAFDAVPIHP